VAIVARLVVVRWLVIVLTTAMALEHLQIGQQILLLSRSIERQIHGASEERDTLDYV
jgi:hypothetical protein